MRSKMKILVAALAILLLAGGAASDWSTYHRDFQRTGYTSEAVNIPLALKWSFTTGGVISSEPTIVNGVAYVGSSDSKLYALDLNTGSLIWNTTLSGTYIGSPTVVNGIVYVGTGGNYIPSKIYAIYANNGTIKWEYNTNSEGSLSSPLVYNNTVFMGYGIYGGGPYGIVALNANYGSYIWSYSDGYAFFSKPAYYNDAIFAGSDSGKVYSFNSVTGAINWQYDTGCCWVWNSPSISNGIVFTGAGSTGANTEKLFAFNANNGSVLWTVAPWNTGGTNTQVVTPVAITSNTIYSVSLYRYSDRTKLYAIDPISRMVKWEFGEKPWFTPPIISGGTVITGSADNNLYLLDASNGNQLWQYNFGARVYSVVVSNGGILAGAGNTIYALTSSPDSIGYSALVATGQNTYVQSSNGTFGLLLKGQTKTINNSVILNNTGDISAKVEARFNDSRGGVFGLVSGANVLNATNFALGIPSALIPLSNTGANVQVAVAPPGATALDARLSVPSNQTAGDYTGTVILTFSNNI